MKRTFHSKLRFLLVAALAAAPAGVHAAEPTPPAAPCPSVPADSLTAQDREVLMAAEQLAQESAQLLEQWIVAQVIAEDQLFSRLYFPVPNTTPRKFTTVYDKLADRDLVGPEDKALARSSSLQYAIVTDSNGYVPAHNTRYTRPLTGDASKDYLGNRTKRLLVDPASIAAARSTARYLIQQTRGDAGEPISDLSVPVMVRGKHWGCVRIGYRRAE